MKAKRRTLKCQVLLPMMPITPLSLVTSTPIQETCKILTKDIFEELIKDMRELRVEMSKLKRSQRRNSLHIFEGSKDFIKKHMYYDSLKHKKKGCYDYDEDFFKKMIFFKESRVKFIAMAQPLELKFERRGIKKLLEDYA